MSADVEIQEHRCRCGQFDMPDEAMKIEARGYSVHARHKCSWGTRPPLGQIERFCRDCVFAVARPRITAFDRFDCRFGPPSRGRYSVGSSLSDEAQYPIVTSSTPACSQFQDKSGREVNERRG